MKILINTSNLKKGGALQVAHSFLNEIKNNTYHVFHAVLSSPLKAQLNAELFPENFIFYEYNLKFGLGNTFLGNDQFLDNLENKVKPDKVFSVFGPTYWKPKTIHITGFAKPQYIYKDSPFFDILNFKEKYKLKFNELIHIHNFKKFSTILITETDDVTNRLKKILPTKEIVTVTNYYHQIYDNPKLWKKTIKLPEFNGTTLLTITANYPHKNLKIIPEVISVLNMIYPDFNFRFVLTIDKDELQIDDEKIENKIIFLGRVDIDECPNLYEQSNFMFLPTLLECFSASYPEAMRMKIPILTSDLPFAKGLCDTSATYFDTISAKDIAAKIVELNKNKNKQNLLVENGIQQLKKFDSFTERAKKYIKIIEKS